MRIESLLLSSAACLAVAAPSAKAELPKGVYSIPLSRIFNQSSYGIEFQLGNPRQTVIGLADTGSNMMSFESPYDEACGRGLCKEVGTYNNKTSSTTEWKSGGFNNAVSNLGFGSYISDTMRIAGNAFSHFQFGQIEEHGTTKPPSRQLAALCGLGALCETRDCDTTLTLIQQLYNRKFIDRRVFSVYLGPNDADAVGTLLIGGIDRAKRQGTVYKRNMVDPMDPESLNMPNRMRIHGYQVQQKGKKTDYSIAKEDNYPAIWDTGIPRWRFPLDVFQIVVKYFNVKNADPMSEQYEVDCKFRQEGLMLPNGKCVIDVGAYALDMGAPFLRGVYATFDYDKLSIEFAQVKYTDKTDIVKVK